MKKKQKEIHILNNNITINTNTLRDDLTQDDVRIFAGSLNVNNHTITIQSDTTSSSLPLFENLKGNVQDLNIVFNNDVIGTPFAYDISYLDENDNVSLSNISLTVNGDILYGKHNYLNYYASIMSSSSNYGN